MLHKSQKLIKLADCSEAGWDAVQEYESQDILLQMMRTTRKFDMLKLQLIGKENRRKGSGNSRAARSVVQRPTRAHRLITFFAVFVSLLFLLWVLFVTLSGALFSSRVLLAPRELPTKFDCGCCVGQVSITV